MPTYNGRNVVLIPTYPPAPAEFEFAFHYISDQSVNPFNATQQVYDWQASFFEASVSMPWMTTATAALWATFIEALKGMTCVFQFGAAICAAYPNELTSDGSTPRYWCLKGTKVQWTRHLGGYMTLTFECREVLPS